METLIMKKLKDELKEVSGMSIQDIADVLDMTRQNLSTHLSNADASGDLNYELNLKLKDKLGIEFAQGKFILHGMSPNFQISPKKDNLRKVINPDDNNQVSPRVALNTFAHPGQEANMILVPLKVQGGFLKGYENRVFMDQLEYYYFPWVKGRCWAFEVEDFSMSPDYNPKDYVVCTEIVENAWSYLSKGKVYVIFTTEGKCIKLFDHIENGFMHLKSINQDYNPVAPIPLTSIKRIFYKEKVIKG